MDLYTESVDTMVW